jgi:hypothetical protein
MKSEKKSPAPMTASRRSRSIVTSFSLVAASMSLCSCLVHKQGDRSSLGDATELELKKQCEQMKGFGNYADVKSNLDRDIAAMLHLNSDNMNEMQARATQLLKQVEKEVADLRGLARPDWTIDRYSIDYNWNLTPTDLGVDDVVGNSDSFRVKTAEVRDARIFGERLARLSDINVKLDRDSVTVSFHRMSSAFDLCEVPRAMAIIVRVKTTSEDGDFSRDYLLKLKDHREGKK